MLTKTLCSESFFPIDLTLQNYIPRAFEKTVALCVRF